MKKILLFLFTLFSIQAFGQNNPALEMLIFPKYIEGSNNDYDGTGRNGIPYVYRARITGLAANTTYRYYNNMASESGAGSIGTYMYVLPPDNVPANTPEHIPGNFFMFPPDGPGAVTNNLSDLDVNYGTFTTDANGTYTGWFIQESVTVYPAGKQLFAHIVLNNPNAANPTLSAYQLYSPESQPLTIMSIDVLNNQGEVPTYGTAIRSTPATSGSPKNFVFLYDNAAGTGRPVAGTVIEDNGLTGRRAEEFDSNGYAAFYFDHVKHVDRAWGTMIPNTDASGIRRIEQRDLTSGEVVGYNTSDDGAWADGANQGGKVATALTNIGTNRDGNTAIVIDGSIVTLGAVKTPQTVAFTNTFPATFKVGDPDFTLSASSSAGLTAFQYTAAPAGILQITGSTVKIVGAGTATITVTEPGNATTAAGTATKVISVDGTPQAITGLPQTFTPTYGDANIVLAATGGASGNAVVYTSDDPTIAEITNGNQVLIKKAGTVIIRANQPGNATYSAAPEVTSTLTIAKAVLDVIAENKTKTQGAANPEATFVFGPFKGTDDAGSVMGTPVLTILADANTKAGVYDITVDVFGMSSDKYTFNSVKGSLTIEAKIDQVITFAGFTTAATYGSQPLPFQVSSNSPNEITFSTSDASVATVAKNATGDWAVTIVGAGEADITAAQAEDAAYAAGSATQHISIAKAPLSVIADDKAILTGEADPVFTARYEGFVNNESSQNLTGTLQFTKQADGANFLIIPSGLTSANYDIGFVNGKLTEGNTAFAAVHKIYGDAIFDPGARSASGTLSAYTIADPTIARANGAGLVQIVGVGSTDITALFSDGGTAVATLTVDQKAVTVTPDAQTRVYAQTNPELTVSYTGLVNGETDFVFTNKPAVTTTATETSPVAKYAITASGATARNYRFNYVPGVLTITQAALIVKADDQSKLYGQVNPALTLSYSGLAPQDNGAALNLQTVVTTTGTAAAKVGTYPITVTGLANTTNYTVTYAGGTLSVTPAPLNIKANDIERAEGQPNPIFAFTYTGFVNGDLAADLTAAPIATTTAVQTSPKGAYPITVTGASSPNYAITYTEGQLLVKGVQTIVYNDLPAVSYGDANFTPAASSETGLQPVFAADNLNVAAIENGRVKIIAAGTANISATFPATADFVAVTVSKPLVVAKRTLIVRADSKSKLYGQANPSLTASYDGFVNGETLATAVSAPAILTTTATPLSQVGTYAITGSAASAQNYTLVYEAGVLTVDKAVLTVTADNKTRAFGLDNPVFTFKYTGFVNAENESAVQIPALAATTAVASSPAGTYPITLSGASDENYTFNYLSGTLTITSTTRTITLNPIPVKFVGDADFIPGVVLTSGETPVFTSSDATIATIVDNKIHVVAAGNVTITATAPDNVNYATKPSASGLLIVSKASQTITFEGIPALKTNGTATIKATSSSGLPVTLTVSDPSYLSVTGDVIKGLRIGRVQVTASQPGNNQYAAAKIVVQDIRIDDADGEGIKVHPALSVNGDGMNEFLTIDGIKDYPLNKVTIINRTGIKVFDVEGYDNDQHVFVGKSKSGTLLPQGTYFALVEYNVDSKIKRKTGYFILKY
ncbi:MBG domain-containing protein [Pedobacter hartonius]|uniref:C-terminal domain of CHU protein family protein n=1 Tax=Pedobacter hartonius TaxID=425514 RepID=A0A1H3W7W6_9SPHI|nr:MBG domain-containing protein [Pedobacter hartonius]SDZ83183.1 C-terminal domain of CHU protein family protein [Pedobacter hartonius]